MPVTYAQGSKIDHYEIIRMLGPGGMNHVYHARDMLNQQDVVLKIPNDDLIGNIAVFERYRREAEIGSRLEHPRIQRLLNTGEERSDDYLVVEYLRGRTLRAVLDEHAPEPLPPSRRGNDIIFSEDEPFASVMLTKHYDSPEYVPVAPELPQGRESLKQIVTEFRPAFPVG